MSPALLRRRPKAAPAPDPLAVASTLQAAALVLAYPQAELLDRLDLIESALNETSAVEQFAAVLNHLRTHALSELQSFHVQEFDLSRRHALHLTYWTEGDTRRRGEVLAEIKGTYRESGLLVDLAGELPDHLPVVLEFAVADPERGLALLQQFRASLELIRIGLAADDLPHAGVIAAICALLPGESPRTRAEVQAQYGQARPVEFVGLNELTGPGRPGAPATPGSLASTADPATPSPQPNLPPKFTDARELRGQNGDFGGESAASSRKS